MMKLTRSQLYLLLALLTVVVGVVTNVATNQMPTWIQPYLWLSWPILGILTVLFIVLSVLQPREEPPQPSRSPERLVVEVKVPEELREKPKPAIPEPPQPYFAHRYPMPENWTGRLDEMDQLDAWLEVDEGAPMCCLIAIGGMGKSSLTWAWLRRRVMARQEALGLSGIFQWSFYEGEISFRRFLEDLSAYLGVSAASDPVTALTQRLAERRVLLVLDGFERLLCAYASADAALLPERAAEELEAGERRCVDLTTARFLRALVADTASKTLLASRLVPEELDRRAGWRLMELPGLDPADAVAYLRACGIRGTRRALRDAAAAYGFHPLSLSKLVEVLHYDIHQPDDVRQAPRYDVTLDLKACQHHILQRAYETLPPVLGQFLSALAALRGKATMEVARFLAGDWPDAELSANLRRLEEDRWAVWEREQRTLDFHPVVRRYVYMHLKDKPGTHARLADYFHPLAETVDTRRVKSVADLAPVIELYHHTVGAGQYDEAYDLFYARLNKPLYYRLGAYQTFVELQSALLFDDEDQLPRLKNEGRRADVLSDTANAYTLSGQPRRAVPLVEAAITIDEKRGNKKDAAVSLSNLATQQILLGELAAAERNLRRRIELCRKIEDEFLEAEGHMHLGRLLAYRGYFEEAERELSDAQIVYDSYGVAQTNFVCVVRAYRALLKLLEKNARSSCNIGQQALELALTETRSMYGGERDVIRAKWILGAALMTLVSEERHNEVLGEAEAHLTEALTRCRRINLIELEPNILLELARLRHAQAQEKVRRTSEVRRAWEAEALSLAHEALDIADRCEYRLVQADCHNFLAQLALALSEVEGLEEGDTQKAQEHAETAHERAWCDGLPHRYEAAFQEAERLLREIEEAKTH